MTHLSRLVYLVLARSGLLLWFSFVTITYEACTVCIWVQCIFLQVKVNVTHYVARVLNLVGKTLPYFCLLLGGHCQSLFDQ